MREVIIFIFGFCLGLLILNHQVVKKEVSKVNTTEIEKYFKDFNIGENKNVQ